MNLETRMFDAMAIKDLQAAHQLDLKKWMEDELKRKLLLSKRLKEVVKQPFRD